MDKSLDMVIKNAVGYDTECSFGEYSGHSFRIEDGSITDSFFKKDSGVNISLGKAGKFGYSYSNSDNWKECLKYAKKVHQSSDKIPYFGIPKKKKSVSFNLDKLKDVNLEKEIDDIMYLAKQYGKGLHSKASFGFGFGKSYFKNSNGQAYSFKRSRVGFYFSLHKKEISGSDYFGGLSLFDYEKIIKSALKNFEMAKNTKKIKSGEYDLVFDYDSVSDLMNIFTSSFFGTRKQEKTSFLADKLNQLVFDTKLTIFDDGTLRNETSSKPFDAEGTPTQKTVLVKNGVVKNFLYDFNSSCRESLQSTGNCGFMGIKPSVSTNNILVQKGDGFSIKEGDILVTDLVGTHMINHITGDFTVQIEGFIKNSGRFYRAKDIMISGNMFKILKDIEIDDEVINKGNSMITPRIKFKSVHVIA